MDEKRITNTQPIRVKNPKSAQSGFTLIELMITLGIMSILFGVSIVGYRSQMEVSQTTEVSSDLRMDLVFSRGEAIKRGGWVGLCATNDSTQCVNSYQNGWMVFYDFDRNGLFNDGDTVLSWYQQPHSAVTIDVSEPEGGTGGPVLFSYRGYPDRAIQVSANRGDSTEGFLLNRSGRLESL